MNYLACSSAVLLACTLAACGNDTGFNSPFRQGPSTPAPAPATAPAPAPSTPAPAPAPPVATSTAAPSAISNVQTCGLPNFQQELMSRINQVRASGRSCGGTGYAAVAALSWNDKLLAASSVHSADMAARNYFSHTGSDGSNGGQRITSAGYRWRMWAENIAAGQTSVNQAMQSWIDSPAHCAALMSNSAVEVGVSCVYTNAGSYKYYWTMNFGAPS